MYQVFIKIGLLCLCGFFSVLGLASEPTGTLPDLTTPPPVINYEEGKHYQRIKPEILANKSIQDLMSENPHKIQVIEFFSYGCFWCARLRPIMESWQKHKPENVVYFRFPLCWNKKFEVLAKAYYIAKSLGKLESLEPDLFADIQQKKIDLGEEKLLSAFFVQHGVPEKKFLDLFQSFSINKDISKATAIANAYQITESPVIFVNGPTGSYKISAKLAGSEQAVPLVLNHIISLESKKLAGK